MPLKHFWPGFDYDLCHYWFRAACYLLIPYFPWISICEYHISVPFAYFNTWKYFFFCYKNHMISRDGMGTRRLPGSGQVLHYLGRVLHYLDFTRTRLGIILKCGWIQGICHNVCDSQLYINSETQSMNLSCSSLWCMTLWCQCDIPTCCIAGEGRWESTAERYNQSSDMAYSDVRIDRWSGYAKWHIASLAASTALAFVYVYTPCLKKTSHLWLAITLTRVNGFWYFFGRNVMDKLSNQKTLHELTCASALPGKMEKR